MLEPVAAVAICVGGVLLFLGWIGMVIAGFSESILWGLGLLIFPVVWFIFPIVEWRAARRPFMWLVWGIVLSVAGVALVSGHLPYERHHHIHLW